MYQEVRDFGISKLFFTCRKWGPHESTTAGRQLDDGRSEVICGPEYCVPPVWEISSRRGDLSTDIPTVSRLLLAASFQFRSSDVCVNHVPLFHVALLGLRLVSSITSAVADRNKAAQ